MSDSDKSAIDPAVLGAVRGASDRTDRYFQAARHRLHIDHRLAPVTNRDGWNRTDTVACRCGLSFAALVGTSLYDQHQLHLDALAYAVIESPEGRRATEGAHPLRPLRTKVDWRAVVGNTVYGLTMLILGLAMVLPDPHPLDSGTLSIWQVLGGVICIIGVMSLWDALTEWFQPDYAERQRRAKITAQTQEIAEIERHSARKSELLAAALNHVDELTEERDDAADALADIVKAESLHEAKGYAATALGDAIDHPPAITVVRDENDVEFGFETTARVAP